MNVKKALPLGAALILGLISARMVVQIIHGKSAPQAAGGPRLVQVVTAARDVTAGEQLDQTALTAGQMVANSAPTGTFSDPAELAGRVAMVPLVKGQAVVGSLLAPVGSAAGLQAVIPAGMRAVTIDVNEVSGVAGFISPGCHVDLLQTVHDDSTNQFLSRCIAQDVLVTAVGVRGSNDDSQAHSITLLSTPRQAELIELACSNGHPRLVLRGASDNKTEDGSAVTLNDLTGIPHAAADAKVAAGDPFAATTQPTARTDHWSVRVIAAGESNLVSVRSAPISGSSAVSGNDVRPVGGQ